MSRGAIVCTAWLLGCGSSTANLVPTAGATTGGSTTTGGGTTGAGSTGGAVGAVCVVGSDCLGGCCAPTIDSSGVVTGHYACKSNDQAAFACCPNVGQIYQCPTGFICAGDIHGNKFCSVVCTSDAACGHTGAACCNAGCVGASCCGACGS
jgi:hypothetical protein